MKIWLNSNEYTKKMKYGYLQILKKCDNIIEVVRFEGESYV